MPTMNTPEYIKTQYADGGRLAVRTALHQRYSVNPQGWFPWLHEQYRFPAAGRVLELGCGNGAQWEGYIDRLPPSLTLLLTDLSPGMLEGVEARFAGRENVAFAQADIQALPFEEGAFDAVIANHMLYHVPDLAGALAEVRRVLKPGGCFYAATNGNGGMRPFLRDAIRRLAPDSRAFAEPFTFSLQNGETLLRRHFDAVERRDYEDALAVTDAGELVAWVASNMTASPLPQGALEGLRGYFEGIRRREGVIRIPKESGLFIAR